MFLRMETTIVFLALVTLLLAGTNVSSNPQCSFASCPRRTLELNVTDSFVVLPCDNLTPVNTTNTIGNYSYCRNEELLVNQSTDYYTLELNISFNGATVCCYNHDIEACGVCYNLVIYYAPTNQRFIGGPTYHFGQPYVAPCESEGNPPPVCRWFRESHVPIESDYIYEFIDDGSGDDIVFDNLVPITSDVTYTNNGCTIHIPRLERIHVGQYFCTATNSLGRGIAGLPTIIFNLCQPRITSIVPAGSTIVKALFNETVQLTCSISPAGSDFTTIQFTYNDTTYGDYVNRAYPDGITINSVYHNENCSLVSTLTIAQFSQRFAGQYSCSSTIFGFNGATGNNVTFNVSLIRTEGQTASDSDENRGLIIGIPLAILLILIFMMVIFIIIRIVSRKRRSALNILKYPPPPYSTEKFKYDAFVSHAIDTEDFAEQVMRKGLKERGYKVQMPGDFTAGHSTDGNIIDAYTASRYIVILFSEKYSHNCSELIYAYSKLEMTRTNCLIPVMCGAMVPETLKHVTYADSEVDDVVGRVAITIGTPLCHD